MVGATIVEAQDGVTVMEVDVEEGQPAGTADRERRPIVQLIELLGRRWQMRIIWELREHPATFRELQTRCGGISPSVLARRLAELREAGVVHLRDDAGSGYALTDAGRELLALYPPLADWAARHLGPARLSGDPAVSQS